jgi:hypothetical protein
MSEYPTHDENGIPYPDDDVDLDATEVLDAAGTRIDRGYLDDSVEALRKAVGRPSLSGRAGRSPGLSIRLDPADDRALRQLAHDRGLPVSVLIQDQVKELLGRQTKRPISPPAQPVRTAQPGTGNRHQPGRPVLPCPDPNHAG